MAACSLCVHVGVRLVGIMGVNICSMWTRVSLSAVWTSCAPGWVDSCVTVTQRVCTLYLLCAREAVVSQ